MSDDMTPPPLPDPTHVRRAALDEVHDIDRALFGGSGPMPDRWYCVSRDGLATLCLNERNARQMVVECERDYPRQAPYRAAMLGDVAAERDRLRELVQAVRDANAAAAEPERFHLLTHAQQAAWLRLLAALDGPNVALSGARDHA